MAMLPTSRRCISIRIFVVLAAVLGLAGAAFAQAPRDISAGGLKDKYALVIGNGAYPGPVSLANPVNDATDIGASLKAIGFATTVVANADLKAMRVAIAQFAAKLPPRAAVVVYYSGHGVQHGGQNYLIPVDAIARIRKPQDLATQTIPFADVLGQLAGRGNAISVFILDACRNSPFTAQPEIGSGLARAIPPVRPGAVPGVNKATGKAGVATDGTLIAYSTAPDMTAADGTGRNSPYSASLKSALRRANTPLEAILKATRSAVTATTKGEQMPWYESSINGDFYPAGRGRIDFDELLKLLLIPAVSPNGISPTAGSWTIGEAAYSPITWRYSGIKVATDKRMVVGDLKGNPLGEYVREGDVVITVDGEPTHHTYLKGKEAVKWRIALTGPRAGVVAVGIRNMVQSQELGSFAVTSKVLKEDVSCRQGRTSEGSTVYDILLPGFKPAWLAAEWSCGSGGCTRDYWLFYSREDRTRYGCAN